MREPSEEQIAEYVASRLPPSECRDFLRPIVEEAKTHWDALGKPYPAHLQSAIDYLEQKS